LTDAVLDYDDDKKAALITRFCLLSRIRNR
jgi:hypothetical protein